MSTYTREQIMDAISNNSPVGVTFDEAVKIANALGLTVEDPKPEPTPGSWWVVTLDGYRGPAYMDDDGLLWRIHEDGQRTTWAHHHITPARVVPADHPMFALQHAVDGIKASNGGAVEIQGVKIVQCDEYGRTR